MTFTDIQTEIAERLNLTSAKALARIGRSINEKYKELSASIGLSTTARGIVTANTVIGSRNLTFSLTEKLYSVFNPAFTQPALLAEVDFDTMRNQPLGSNPARSYAIQLMGASTVTIFLSSIPDTIYALSADAELNVVTLSNGAIPAFAENYHNLLVYGGMAVELDKMEKYDLAEVQNNKYEKRLAELRLYIALTAYKDITQGSRGRKVLHNSLLV